MTIAYTHRTWITASSAQGAEHDSVSDETLIERIAQSDQLSMRTLFARHRVPLYHWLLRIVDDETLAEDLLSEVFLDVWRQAAFFEARSSVSTWLLAIARYKALSAPAVGQTPSWTKKPRPRCPTARTILRLLFRRRIERKPYASPWLGSHRSTAKSSTLCAITASR